MKSFGTKAARAAEILCLLLLLSLFFIMTVVNLRIFSGDGEFYISSGDIGAFLPGYIRNAPRSTLFLAFALSLPVAGLAFYLYSGRRKLFRFLYKYRWLIGAGLVLLCTLFEINNTALYQWHVLAGLSGDNIRAPFWGVSRTIRSDEWSTWSPLVFSQAYHGFPAVNTSVAGGNLNTAWISIGGVPAFSLAAFFKPFYWGFLALGAAKGYGFLFGCRLVCLFLVSFDLAGYYTKRNKVLSLAAAFMITLSPFIQWWFSQSVCEMLIFSQGIVLCLLRFFEAEGKKRLLWAALGAWCLGCYIMIGYIAWLVCIGYIAFPVCILILVKNRKSLTKKNTLSLFLPLLPVLALLGIIFAQSWDTLMAVSDSYYPGHRMLAKPYLNSSVFSGLYGMFLSFARPSAETACECAGWITLAPAGLFLCVAGMIRKRKADLLALICIGVEILFLVHYLAGLPEWLAKVTLLFQANRPFVAIGLADTILFFKGLSEKKSYRFLPALLLGVVMTALQMLLITARYQIDSLMFWILVVLHLLLFCAVFRAGAARDPEPRQGRSRTAFAASCLIIIAVAGGIFVNPLQAGVDAVTKPDLIRQVQETGTEEDIWMTDLWENIPLMAGKKVFTSTQYYPIPEYWKQLDPEGKYEYDYNRFFHINIELTEEETSFKSTQVDLTNIRLDAHTLPSLGVTYVLSQKDYPESWCGLRWERTEAADGYKIYHVTPEQ